MIERIPLDGTWQVARAGDDDWIDAEVPGCVHTALLAAGLIEDPFFRDNEDRLQWITEADWVYRREFDAPAAALGGEHVVLRFDGLDTLATVTLNGTGLGRTDNMFRAWEFDVRGLLRERGNRLEILFASPLPYLAERERIRHLPDWHGPGRGRRPGVAAQGALQLRLGLGAAPRLLRSLETRDPPRVGCCPDLGRAGAAGS